ncbi:hypothetical protein [Cardinium endosymbiont of Sogatella furcifera]|uniref:hypothetical protein n=1 Tax=Cardinium endosymbiont of Sogatella furcifera TaxID=650378 RepID=UPI0013B44E95|nr:hypothetical protein [Cardinium endosymbiont of Sogatella furcifera]
MLCIGIRWQHNYCYSTVTVWVFWGSYYTLHESRTPNLQAHGGGSVTVGRPFALDSPYTNTTWAYNMTPTAATLHNLTSTQGHFIVNSTTKDPRDLVPNGKFWLAG